MNIDRLKKQLIKDEGKRLKVYEDHLGYKTVGIGHLIKDTDDIKDLVVGDKISEAKCEALFIEDLAIAIADAKIIFEPVWADMPSIVREVTVNMLFNLGRSRFLGFKKTISAILLGEYERAAAEMLDSKWAKQVPSRAYRLSSQMENYKNYI